MKWMRITALALVKVLLFGVMAEAQSQTTGRLRVPRDAHTATLLSSGKVLVAGGWHDGGLSSTELYDPSAGTWADGENLNTPRFWHTSTLLPSGKVLAIGGWGAFSSVEIYDPNAGEWVDAEDLATPRARHTSTVLPSGKVLVVGGFHSSALSDAEIYDPSMDTWTPAGHLATPRSWHSSTLLPSGKVLVIGGQLNDGPLASAEIYDPSTNTWADARNLASARYWHTATLLPTGNVLVGGGYNGNSLASVEIYDPSRDRWFDARDLTMPRYRHTSTLLPSGKVLVVGGVHNGGPVASAEIYDPSTNTWADAGNLITGRRQHTSTLLPSGSVLAAGGGHGGVLSSAEIYDPSMGTWAGRGNLATPRKEHTATLLLSGEVLTLGGSGASTVSSAEKYDPSAETWSDAGSLITPRDQHTSTLLDSGTILVAGGGNGGPLQSAEIYHPSTEMSNTTSNLATARKEHTATRLPSGEVLVTGGIGVDDLFLTSTEVYDPNVGDWADTGNLASARYRHTSTLLPSGKVLIAGGLNGGFLTSVEIYDPNTEAWADTGYLATPRALHTSTLLPSGKVLVVGGYSSTRLSSAEIYDPDTESWADTGHLATPRYRHTATLLPSGKVLVAGGYDNVSGNYISSAEMYDPSTGTWADAGNLTTPRDRHTSTLLPSGEILVVGGSNGNSLLSAEIYEVSPPPESRRPTIQSTSLNLRYGESFPISGLFRGDSEASGGNSRNSAVNYPIIHLRSWDGTEHHMLAPDPQPNFWDTPRTLNVSNLPPAINPGRHLLTLTVAGVPSAPPVPVEMECSLAITAHPADQEVLLGGTATFTVETQGGRLYQWQKNGIDIPGATDPTYTTPEVTVADDRTQYRVFVDGGCINETSETARLIIFDETPPAVDVTYPNGGEYWLLSDPDAETPNTEIINWTMSDNVRICLIEVELTYSNDHGETWQSAGNLTTLGDADCLLLPGELATSYTYSIPTLPPSDVEGSLYKIRIHVSDREHTTTDESVDPFFMTHRRPDISTLILTNSSRMEATPDLDTSLQNLADHPAVLGFIVDLADVNSTTINNLYGAWDSTPPTATANDVLFAAGGIHDYILNLLEVYPDVEHLIVVGDDHVIPMTRLDDRTFRLPESEYEYADPMGDNPISRDLAEDKYFSDDLLATRYPLRPNQLGTRVHLADLGIGRLVETPEEISAAIAAFIQQDGVLDLPLRNPKALVTGYDFLQDSARKIDGYWSNIYTPEEVDGSLISSDWGVEHVQDRRDLLADALTQAAGFMSLGGHATHSDEGVPGINRFEIVGLPATDIATLDLTGCIIYAIGCHGGLNVPDEADLPQSFLGAGATAYLAGSGYGWGLLQGIGLAERLAVILTEEFATSGSQAISGVIRRGKERYYRESPRWDAYDVKTLYQPILYGFPMYTFQTDATPPPSSPPLRVTRDVSRSPLPPHVIALDLSFDLTGEDVYQKYDVDGGPTADCPIEGCYYELNGLANGESDLPIEPYFLYNSSLAATSQHGILWLGGPYLEESGWTPIFGLIASNEEDEIVPGSTPPMILLPPRGPRPTGPPDVEGACPAQDGEVNSVVVTTGEVAQDESGEYSIHRLMQELDLEVFYFNNLDDPDENCDREGPVFIGDEHHRLLGTTLNWTVDVQDDSGVWRVLVVWDDQQEARWSPLELSYDGEHWIGSLPVAGRGHLTYVLQAVDRRGNVAWKEVNTTLPDSGVPLGLADPIIVDIGPGQADLQAALAAPLQVDSGDTFATTITVHNDGPDQANQLTATLTLPTGMIYTFGGNDDWTCSLDESNVRCISDVLASGATSDVFILLIAPEIGGEYLLNACVDAAEGDPSEPSCDETSILVIDESMTDLSIVKEDGGVLAVPNEPLIYSITVSNQGPNPAHDALVIDIFPDELHTITWTCTATVGSSCTPSGNDDIMDLVEIASGGTLIYTVHTTVDENVTSPVINTATVEVSPAMVDIHPPNDSHQIVTHTPDTFIIFSDGFESGDCSEWSSCFDLH